MRRHRAVKFDASEHMRRAERDQRMAAKMSLVKRPKVDRPILSKDRRRAVIFKMVGAMSEWSHSAFEWEGSARHAVRSALCLRGYSWDRSDEEARAIVAGALKEMGAQRPSWEEGQWRYTEGRDCCKHCCGPLEAGWGESYCGPECARASLEERVNRDRRTADRQYMVAYKVLQRATMPARPCVHCGKDFHPRKDIPSQQFCSRSCANKVKADAMRLVPKEVMPCIVCGNPFETPPKSRAQYCSVTCQGLATRARRGDWHPRDLNRVVFEVLIIGRDQPPTWLPPERFDELVAA